MNDKEEVQVKSEESFAIAVQPEIETSLTIVEGSADSHNSAENTTASSTPEVAEPSSTPVAEATEEATEKSDAENDMHHEAEDHRLVPAEWTLSEILEEMRKASAAQRPEENRTWVNRLYMAAEERYGALSAGGKASERSVVDEIQRLRHDFVQLLHLRYETRDMSRWEHYTLKLEILKELEHLFLVADEELLSTVKKLKTLQEAWRGYRTVPHEKEAELKRRHRAITKKWHQRLDKFFETLNQSRDAAQSRKLEILAEAEKMVDSRDWQRSAEKFKLMQQEWQSLPAAPGDQERELYKRFRECCNTFFRSREKDLAERRVKRDAAEATKRQCCDEAEALNGASMRPMATALRDKWKSAGYAGRVDQELYERFEKAMDVFFASLRQDNDRVSAEFRSWCEAFENAVAVLKDITEDGVSAALAAADELRERGMKLAAPDFKERRELFKRARIASEDLDKIKRDWKSRLLALELRQGVLTESIEDVEPEKLAANAVKRRVLCQDLAAKLPDEKAEEATKERDLAAELQAAFVSNFGGGSVVKETLPDARQFVTAFVKAGPVSAEERDELLAEAERLLALLEKARDNRK